MVPTRFGKLSTFVLPLTASMVVLAAGGCAGLVFLLAGDSGITGQVVGGGCGTIDPSQPPPDCGYSPIEGSFTVYETDCQTVVTRVTSEPDGAFRVSLLPGTYCIRETLMGPVVVTPGEYTEVTVVFEAE